jgi:AGCS family alanine or glycine:cation symporter
MIIDHIFQYLSLVDSLYWSYIGIYIVVLTGLYFSFKSKFYQLQVIGNIKKTVRNVHYSAKDGEDGISPFRLYFASVGGMVGLGNVVAVITAILIGGPGALFWLWIAAICGMLIKYSEVYLGVKHRVKGANNTYHGGSIYYLREAFKKPYASIIAASLICVYGIEIFQFKIVTEDLTEVINNIVPVKQFYVMLGFLALVLYSSFGGVKRMANICSLLMPAFIIIYMISCLVVLISNYNLIPATLMLVLKSAFTGHAPLGGFAGSTMLIAAQQGIARAVYSGDIAVGYDSIIQSETKVVHPEKQASLAILSSFTDTIICTMSILIVLITGVWTEVPLNHVSEAVSTALSGYIPYIKIFMSALIFLAGYTTIIAYLTVGTKCASFLSPKYGRNIYVVIATIAFIMFSFIDSSKLYIIMSLTGGALVFINTLGIIRLRKEVKFG